MIRAVLILATAVIVVIVLLVVVIGYALPVSHVGSGTAVFAVPADEVFAAIAEVGRYPEWRQGINRVEVISTEPLRWREHSDGDALTFEVTENRPPQRRTVRIADPSLPFGGTWTYDLETVGSGTRLTITEHGEVYNPVFRFMSRFVFGHTATIERFLEDLESRR